MRLTKIEAGVIIAMVAGGLVTGLMSTPASGASSRLPFSVTLYVEPRHADGTLVAPIQVLPGDLVLDNFNNILLSLFQNCSTPPCTASLKDTAGTTRTPSIWGTATSSTFSLVTINAGNTAHAGGEAETGTSGTAPTRGDSAMGAANPNAFTDETQHGCVTVSGKEVNWLNTTITETASVTIQEGGFFIFGAITTTTAARFMLFHDTFTGIPVVNLDTVKLAYKLTWNDVGFNQNLCRLFDSLFGNGGLSANAATFALTDTTGANTNYCTWTTSTAVQSIVATSACTANAMAANNVYLAVGASSPTFSPTSTALGSQINSNGLNNAVYSSTLGEIWFNTGVKNPNAGSVTFTEYGVFVTLSSKNYLFWAQTFTGVPVNPGLAIGVTTQVAD